MTFARALGYGLCLWAGLVATPSWAMDQQGINAFTLRVVKALGPQRSVDGMISGRWRDGFDRHDRGNGSVSFTERRGDSDFNFAYQGQFYRYGQTGMEHRLWQQLRHRFRFSSGTYELSGRLEERFLPNDRSGERFRLFNRWSQPVAYGFNLNLGYEWMYNLSTLSPNTRKGVNHRRVMLSLQRPVLSIPRMDWEYQIGVVDRQRGPSFMQHQLQVRYSLNL